MEVPACREVRDGKVTRVDSYYDVTEILKAAWLWTSTVSQENVELVRLGSS